MSDTPHISSPIEPVAFETLDLDGIANDIENGNAILFLGPGATVDYYGGEALQRFYDQLDATQRKWVRKFHEGDSLLIFNHEGRNRLNKDLAEFYSKDFKNDLLNTLAEIPFHLIISLTPDHTLAYVYQRMQVRHRQLYNNRKHADIVGHYDANFPLIYNLLGSFVSRDSLVVSHGDLFKSIDAIHRDQCLPIDVLSEFSPRIQQTKSLIFIGLDYDKWYFHFLVHLLQLNERVTPYATASEDPTDPQRALYEAHYKVKWVQDRPLEFAQALLKKIPEASRRKPQPQREPMRKFLLAAMSSIEFEALCASHFPDVRSEFTDGQFQSQRILFLLDHVQEKGLWQLLMQIAQEANPAQFALHFPDHGR